MNQRMEGVKLNYAVVIRCNLTTLNEIEEFLKNNLSVQIIYQKTSGYKLFICEDNGGGDK